jgi:hypothetical protein
MTKRERKKKQIIIYELHSKLKIAQHNSMEAIIKRCSSIEYFDAGA